MEAAFRERVLEAPDDDGPRLIYADWLDEQGDPRGEFIRIQIALARISPEDPNRAALRERELELLRAHYHQWTEPLRGLAGGLEFRRGFVETCNIEADRFVQRGEELLRCAPIRHVRLLDIGGLLGPIVASPLLMRLRELTIFASYQGDMIARLLAWSPFTAGLKALHLGRNKITDSGADALAASRHLSGLTLLDLQDNSLTDAGAQALAGSDSLPSLHRLNLTGNQIGTEGFCALAASPRLGKLAALNLARNRVGRQSPRLPRGGGLPRLRRLSLAESELTADQLARLLHTNQLNGLHFFDLTENRLGSEGVRLLAEHAAAASLRVLLLANNRIEDDGVAALAGSTNFGYLHTLDLSTNPIRDAGVQPLLQARHLRFLRRVALPSVGISQRVRRAALRRFSSQIDSQVW